MKTNKKLMGMKKTIVVMAFALFFLLSMVNVKAVTLLYWVYPQFLYGLDIDTDGTSLYIIGKINTTDSFIMKTHPDGSIVWQKEYSLSCRNIRYSAYDNSLVVSGVYPDGIITLKKFFAVDGSFIWEKNVTFTVQEQFGIAYEGGIDVDELGNIFFVGKIFDKNGNSICSCNICQTSPPVSIKVVTYDGFDRVWFMGYDHNAAQAYYGVFNKTNCNGIAGSRGSNVYDIRDAITHDTKIIETGQQWIYPSTWHIGWKEFLSNATQIRGGYYSITDVELAPTGIEYLDDKLFIVGYRKYNETYYSPLIIESPYANITEKNVIEFPQVFSLKPYGIASLGGNIYATGMLGTSNATLIEFQYIAPHVSVYKHCEKNSTISSGELDCYTEPIFIPSNAVNISARTITRISPYNATTEGDPSKTFLLRSCNPEARPSYAGGAQCRDIYNVCRWPDYFIPNEKYGDYLAGQTVTGNGYVNIPSGCIVPAGATTYYYGLFVDTYVDYDLMPIPTEKSVSLQVSPTSGNTTTIFNFLLTTYNLAKPYNISVYVDDAWLSDLYNIYTDTYTVPISGFSVGTHKIYEVVRDKDGWQNKTNDVYINVVGVGIREFSLSVTPSVGNATDVFTFRTTQISGGVAPYTVTIYLNTTDREAGSCTNVPENGICTLSTLLPCGNWTAFAVARDGAGGFRTSSTIPVSVICKPLGAPLNATLSMTPLTGDSKTVFTFTLNIVGGAPPYYVSWLDYSGTICGNERYDQEPPLTITERYSFWAGSHGISTSIYSSDGQSTASNRLDFNVAWAGEANITAYDCKGTYGYRVERPTVPIEQQIPLVNETALREAGAGWLVPFFTPLFFSTIMLIGISGLVTVAISKYSGGGEHTPMVFGLVALVMIAIYGILGIYPSWLVIVLIILAGFIFAKMVGILK
jgi:hypothetical protein